MNLGQPAPSDFHSPFILHQCMLLVQTKTFNILRDTIIVFLRRRIYLVSSTSITVRCLMRSASCFTCPNHFKIRIKNWNLCSLCNSRHIPSTDGFILTVTLNPASRCLSICTSFGRPTLTNEPRPSFTGLFSTMPSRYSASSDWLMWCGHASGFSSPSKKKQKIQTLTVLHTLLSHSHF